MSFMTPESKPTQDDEEEDFGRAQFDQVLPGLWRGLPLLLVTALLHYFSAQNFAGSGGHAPAALNRFAPGA